MEHGGLARLAEQRFDLVQRWLVSHQGWSTVADRAVKIWDGRERSKGRHGDRQEHLHHAVYCRVSCTAIPGHPGSRGCCGSLGIFAPDRKKIGYRQHAAAERRVVPTSHGEARLGEKTKVRKVHFRLSTDR